MHLWTQVRQLGVYDAQCMLASLRNETLALNFSFDIFTHATRFFGFKAGGAYKAILRVTKGRGEFLLPAALFVFA